MLPGVEIAQFDDSKPGFGHLASQYSRGCTRVRLSREHAQEHLNDVRTLFIAHLSLNSSDL